MTNQEKVIERYPRAVAYRCGAGLKARFIVWADRARLAEGKTSAEAWKRAAERLEERYARRLSARD